MKAVPRGKFIVLNVYIRKGESLEINELSIPLKKVEHKHKINPKES